MRRTSTRHSALVVTALLLAGCGVGANDSQSIGFAAEQDANQRDVDPAAAFLMQDLGIDADEAQRRLDLQLKTPALEADLRALFPQTFAGLWIDQHAGGAVTIAIKGGEQRAVEEARKRGFHATGVAVTWSGAELAAAQRRLEPSAAALGLSLGVDVRANQVLIRQPPGVPTRAVTALLAEEPRGLVRVETNPGSTTDR